MLQREAEFKLLLQKFTMETIGGELPRKGLQLESLAQTLSLHENIHPVFGNQGALCKGLRD